MTVSWWSRKTVFVTGASGFIGSHIAEALAGRGAQLRCLVRPTSQREHLLRDGIQLVEGSVERPDSYRHAIDDCDAVIHVAGLTHAVDCDRLFRVNAEACGMLADICAAAGNPPRLTFISSVAAAGPVPSGCALRDETHRPLPVSDYGFSKRQGEIEFQKRASRVPVTVIRPGVVFGPRDRVMERMLWSIYRLRVHMVIGFRTPPLSLIHVDDLVRLVLSATESGQTLEQQYDDGYSPEGVYFACDDSEFPDYGQLGQRMAQALNRRVLVWPLWRWVGTGLVGLVQAANRLRGRSSLLNLDKVREAKARSWAASAAKARRQLGWGPAKDLDTRLQETADWYVQHRGW